MYKVSRFAPGDLSPEQLLHRRSTVVLTTGLLLNMMRKQNPYSKTAWPLIGNGPCQVDPGSSMEISCLKIRSPFHQMLSSAAQLFGKRALFGMASETISQALI